MAVSVNASKKGLEIVDRARRERGWKKASNQWCEAANASSATLKRFWLGHRIKRESFIGICQAVGVDWRQVAEQSLSEEVPPQGSFWRSPPAAVLEKPTAADIDWRSLCSRGLEPQKRLTTNPLTTNDGLEFTLDEIYVPLGLVERRQRIRIDGDISPERGSKLYDPEPEDEKNLFPNEKFFSQVLCQGKSGSKGGRLAFVGEPGSGKTTLLQKVAFWVLENTEDIPIFISLASLRGKSLEAYLLEDWLKTITRKIRVPQEMEESLAELFNSGRVWLLLDGVAEMKAADVFEPLSAIASQLIGWIAPARVLLTCRSNLWDIGKNALEGFDVYRILDFSYGEATGTDRVKEFIGNWFQNRPELGDKLRAELDLPENRELRDVVKNPLRLALLCRHWSRRGGDLPNQKTALYQKFIEALYEWKKEIFPTTLEDRQKLNEALGRLAFRANIRAEKSKFSFSHSFLCEVLGKSDASCHKLALDLGFLNAIGIAKENPDEFVYAFFHPTFQKYFAERAMEKLERLAESARKQLPESVEREKALIYLIAEINELHLLASRDLENYPRELSRQVSRKVLIDIGKNLDGYQPEEQSFIDWINSLFQRMFVFVNGNLETGEVVNLDAIAMD